MPCYWFLLYHAFHNNICVLSSEWINVYFRFKFGCFHKGLNVAYMYTHTQHYARTTVDSVCHCRSQHPQHCTGMANTKVDEFLFVQCVCIVSSVWLQYRFAVYSLVHIHSTQGTVQHSLALISNQNLHSVCVGVEYA